MTDPNAAPRRPDATATPEAPRHGDPTRGVIAVRLLLVLLLVLLDQWTKSAVWELLEPGMGIVEGVELDPHLHERMPLGELLGGGDLPLVGDRLGLMLSLNPGAAFGRFGDYPHILVGGRILAVALLGWLLVRSRRGEGLGLVALVLVLAGAAGNLVDNLWTGGEKDGHPYGLVRDFIDVWFRSEAWGWDWHFHTFNVADACITVGAVLWILASFLHREPRAEPADEEAESLDAMPGSSHSPE